MSQKEALARYNSFRKLCLINAEANIKAAVVLTNQAVNHVAFHLLVLAIEEIGKIFVGFNELVKDTRRHADAPNFGFDDHVKKLFWAIWGPLIGTEAISKEQWEEIQRMATDLHEQRLASLYTALDDTVAATDKITDEELVSLFSFARARLELAKLEGEADIHQSDNLDMDWFARAVDEPERRRYIFGTESQAKLLELGNPRLWVAWLKSRYEEEAASLAALMEAEMQQERVQDLDKVEPRWKIKIKLHSPSHTIRQNILDEANKNYRGIQLFKGGGTQTLLVEFTLGANTPITQLWQQGWTISKLYVGALNACSNGIFYWNVMTDREKYYESIKDLQHNKMVDARLEAGLELAWSQRKMGLNFEHLMMTKTVFEYFLTIRKGSLMQAVWRYFEGLALLAKSDMHARFEPQMFHLFFIALCESVSEVEKLDAGANITEIAHRNMEKMVGAKATFEATLALGYELQEKGPAAAPRITLSEVILMKQYCGFYFMTLAVRSLYNDDTMSLVLKEGEL